jgi:hypothetical protein
VAMVSATLVAGLEIFADTPAFSWPAKLAAGVVAPSVSWSPTDFLLEPRATRGAAAKGPWRSPPREGSSRYAAGTSGGYS